MRTDRIAALTSLALLFSLAENLIPKPLPFFRLGLANIPLLLAVSKMGACEFFALSFLKAVANSYLAGTLFSPFFLISLSQSLTSAIAMYICQFTLKDHVSLYGISLTGAAASAFTQLFLASMLIGSGIWSLLPLFLILSFVAAFITAHIAKHIHYDIDAVGMRTEKGTGINRTFSLSLFLIIFFSSILESIALNAALFVLMILISLHLKRKFRPLNYITLIAISLFSSLIVPRGEVIARVLAFPITDEALRAGMRQALRLSITVIESLTFSRYALSSGFLSSILSRFFEMESAFYATSGSIKKRINSAINVKISNEVKYNNNKIPYFTSFFILIVLISLNILDTFVL